MRRNPIAFAALTGLSLTACMESTQPAATGQTWHGLMRNSCGPADGPEVHVVLDTAAYADCASSHQGEYSMQIQKSSIDDITVGRTFTYQGPPVCADGESPPCPAGFEIRLGITQSDSNETRASFRIDRGIQGWSSLVDSGSVVLSNCPERPLCG